MPHHVDFYTILQVMRMPYMFCHRCSKVAAALPALEELSITSNTLPLDFPEFLFDAPFKLKFLSMHLLPFDDIFARAYQELIPDDSRCAPQVPCLAQLTDLEILVFESAANLHNFHLFLYRLDALTRLKLHVRSWSPVRRVLRFITLAARLVSFSVQFDAIETDDEHKGTHHFQEKEVNNRRRQKNEVARVAV